MAVKVLRDCQTHDPARGSFFVNPLPVKRGEKQVYRFGRPVTRGSHHIDRETATVSPHPYAIDFVIS